MQMEAVILTGGQSRRMGRDKATLPIEGVPQAERLVRVFREQGIPVTVLGRFPVEGAEFLRDSEEFAGPVAALSRFEPLSERVFVASCDLPRFDVRIVSLLESFLSADAAVPISDGFRQPLCALYRARAFEILKVLAAEGLRCPTKWLDRLDVREVSEEEQLAWGGDVNWSRGANTPEELERVLHDRL